MFMNLNINRIATTIGSIVSVNIAYIIAQYTFVAVAMDATKPRAQWGEDAPGLRGRETLATGDKKKLPIGGGKIVFLDVGPRKNFTRTDDSDEVLVFKNLAELNKRLKPIVIVLDSLPGKLENTAAELAKTGIIFLRLKDPRKVSEERKNNGVNKSDENDVVVLKMLFRRNPDDFQPLFTAPEVFIVKELTEEWATFTLMKKVSK
jgi:hypothetical protein